MIAEVLVKLKYICEYPHTSGEDGKNAQLWKKHVKICMEVIGQKMVQL